jgi:hypothetical protein
MNQGQKKIVIWVCAAAVVSLVVIFAYILFGRERAGEEQSPQVTSEETQSPSPEPSPTVNPHKNMVRSQLTGQWIKKSTAKKRPFAVMINNIEYAFKHQMGTSKADIIYEALAEGGITRMMAVYEDVKGVKKIGSVRSARHYYVQFAYEWNAIYCHFGHTKYATAMIEKLKINNLSGLSGIGSVVYARTSSLYAPHNVFTSGKKLLKGAKKLKYSTKRNTKKMAEHFTFAKKDTSLAKGEKAKNVVIPFSNYSTCKMKYNAKKKLYMKYEYGSKHMDRYYKKQLSFKNVIIQIVKEKNKDHNGYQTMELTNVKNTGTGYYITNGRRIPIRWMRKESSNEMCYYTKDGEVLTLNPGKTYIAVYPKNRNKLIRFK